MIENTELKQKVEKFIIQQSIQVNIIKCYAPGKKHCQRYYGEDRLINEPIARQLCQSNAIKLNDEYCIIQDDDIVQLHKNNFELMQNFLINNKDYGAISISGMTNNPNKIPDHVKISCVMFRLECLNKIEFIRSTTNNCMCADVTRSIRNAKYKFDFLDEQIRVMELS